MGVHDDGGNAETGGEDHRSGFAAHPGKARKVLHGLGDRAPVTIQELPGEGLDIVGLGPEKAGAVDNFFQIRQGGIPQGSRVRETAKEDGAYQVYRGVGTLGGKDRGYQELEGGVIVKQGFPAGVEGAQDIHSLPKPGFFFHTGNNIPKYGIVEK
jgi:hypothetical protein